MKKYQPSNGSEGDWFIDSHCAQCIREKFMHTNNDNDKKCDIFSRTLVYHVTEPEYPSEWTFDENENPICTEFKKWDWDNDGDPDDRDNPKAPTPEDPNQLCFPFIIDEFNYEHPTTKKETHQSIQRIHPLA